MKIKITLAIIMILSLFSCANDDMFRMGKMDSKVEVSMVLPTSAIITVTIPKDQDNILIGGSHTLVNLSDKPLNSSQNFWDEVNFTFKEELISEDSQNNTYQYWVYDLNPNTTYYVLLNTPMNNFVYYHSYKENNVYYTNESFTTAKKGDHSGLGEIVCEVTQRYNSTAYIKVTLPPNLKFNSSSYSYLELSTNPDLSKCISSIFKNPNGNEQIVYFNDLPDGIYYCQLFGHLKFLDGRYEISDNPITLKAKTTLDLNQ